MVFTSFPIAFVTVFVEKFHRIQNRLRIYALQIKHSLIIGRNTRIIPLSYFWVGRNVTIAEGAILDCGGQIWCDYKGGIRIGNNSYIGYNCVLLGGGGIEIGEKVLISPGTIITSQGHFFKETGKFIKDQKTYLAKIVIEDDVWVGANVTVLPGVILGKGCVIGAGAVVTKDIPQYAIAAGIPAKVIGNRK